MNTLYVLLTVLCFAMGALVIADPNPRGSIYMWISAALALLAIVTSIAIVLMDKGIIK